jgi:PTS system N-acetylgalactosamine-specific IIA component
MVCKAAGKGLVLDYRTRRNLTAFGLKPAVERKGDNYMRYLLLVSHGTMAPGVHSVIRMLLGDRDNVLSYSMEDGVSADDFVAALGDVVAPITPDDSVVVLGDIMGGSPLTNTLNLLTQRGLLANTIAFGGLSLPMAIAALMGIEDGLEGDAFVENVLTEARSGATKVELVLDDDDDDEEDL